MPKINFFTLVGIIYFGLLLLHCVLNVDVVKISDNSEYKRYRREVFGEKNQCAISRSYLDKTATYKCSKKAPNQSCIVNGGTAVLEFTTATFVCKPGYHLSQRKTTTWVCLDNAWSPKLPKCEKICDDFMQSPSVNNIELSCFRNNIPIDCNGLLIAGDRVRPTCKPLHTYRDFFPNYSELVCLEDGRWDNILFSCVPECGRRLTTPLKLISNGAEERFGDSPWNVAIYNSTDKVLLCSGTIITPYMILSAAHCFHNRFTQEKQNASRYEIVVSKFTRNYTVVDNPYQQAFKIKTIEFCERGYYGHQTNFANDIAILTVDGKMNIGPTVMPACLNWTRVEMFRPPEDTLGKIVGWGYNEHRNLSEKLITANLPFISNSRCIKMVPEEFKPYVNSDKFCAGSDSGPTVLQGDSGAGLVFIHEGLYFLRGIVSIKQPATTAIASFTDLADHVLWIGRICREYEQEIMKKGTAMAING